MEKNGGETCISKRMERGKHILGREWGEGKGCLMKRMERGKDV